eukprot:jgi/Mesen1/8955/ME000056S08365
MSMVPNSPGVTQQQLPLRSALSMAPSRGDSKGLAAGMGNSIQGKPEPLPFLPNGGGHQRRPSADNLQGLAQPPLPGGGFSKPQIPPGGGRQHSMERRRGGAAETSSQGSLNSVQSSPNTTPKRSHSDQGGGSRYDRSTFSGESPLPDRPPSYGGDSPQPARSTYTDSTEERTGGSFGRSAYYAPSSASPKRGGPIPDNYTPTSRGMGTSGGGGLTPTPGSAAGATTRDFRADLAAAEAAIEELQAENVTWQRASRNLSREVENLRSQLAEAMTQDRAAEVEISTLAADRDRLRDEIDELARLREEAAAAAAGGASAGAGGGLDAPGGSAGSKESSDLMHRLRDLEEELAFQKEAAENLSAQVQSLQDANEELELAGQESVEQYKKDLEDLFESNKEQEALAKRTQLALEDKDREWKERLRKVTDAYAELERKLVEREKATSAPALAAGGDVSEEAEGGSSGAGAGARSEKLSGADAELVAELEQKVEELEKEAQELTDESLQLAADLTRANKELEGKSAAMARMEAEMERVKAQQPSLFSRILPSSSWGADSQHSGSPGGSERADALSAGGVGSHSDGERYRGSQGLAGGISGAAATAEVARLQNRVRELEAQLRQAEEQAAAGGASGGGGGGGGQVAEKLSTAEAVELRGLRNKFRLAEMAVEQANERLVIFETIERRAKELEAEVEEKQLEVEREADERAALAARHKEELRELEDRQREELERVEDEKVNAERKLARVAEELDEAQRRASELEAEREDTMAKLTEHYSARKEMEATSSGLANERMDLAQKLEEVETFFEQADARVHELEEELEQVAAELADVRKSRDELEKTAGALGEERSALERRFRDADEQRRLGESRVQELELQVSAMSELLAEAKATAAADGDAAEAQSQLEEMRAECKAAGKRVLEMESQLRATRDQFEAHVAARREAEGRLEAAQEERARLEARLEEVVEGKHASQGRVAELEGELVAIREKMSAHAAAKREAEMRALGLEGSARSLEQEVHEAKAERRKALDKAAALEAQLALLGGEVASHAAARRTLEARVAALQKEAVAHVEKNQALEARALDLHTSRGSLEDRIRSLDADHAETMARCAALEGQLAQEKAQSGGRIQELQRAHDRSVAELEQMKTGRSLSDARAEKSEAAAKRAQAEKASALERLQAEVQALTEQLSSGSSEKDVAAQALVDASELRAEKGELEDKLRRAQADLFQHQTQRDKLTIELEIRSQLLATERNAAKAREAALAGEIGNLRAATASMQETLREAERLRDENASLGAKLAGLRASEASLVSSAATLESDKRKLEGERTELLERARQVDALQAELHTARQERQVAEEQRVSLAARVAKAEQALAGVDDLRLKHAALEGEREELSARAEDAERLREDNSMLMQQFMQLQQRLDEELSKEDRKDKSRAAEQLASRAAAVLAEEAASLKMQTSELKRRVAEQHSEMEAQKAEIARLLAASGGPTRKEKAGIMSPRGGFENSRQVEELRRKLVALEVELQRKSDALVRSEKKLREHQRDSSLLNDVASNGGGDVTGSATLSDRPTSRSMSKSSRVGPMSPSTSQRELAEYKDKTRALEDREKVLVEKMGHMQVAHDELKASFDMFDSGADQLHSELVRLQQQNAVLTKRERELASELSTQEMLRSEVQRLQEANDKMQKRVARFRSTGSGNMAERMAVLETELAEALESKEQYKEQLRKAFANKDGVQSAAIQNMGGDVESIILEMQEAKKAAKAAEEDLNSMMDKYSAMSLKFAEVEAQREELVMMLRASRNGRKPPLGA